MTYDNKYRKNLIAYYLAFITQAIAANFAPLLFLTFHKNMGIPLGKVALVSTAFYFTQLIVDVVCAKFVDRIGYRVCAVASEIASASGLVCLAFLPSVLPDPFVGIIVSVIIYAVGSGLIEVLASPIVEVCPFDHKEAVMSLLNLPDRLYSMRLLRRHNVARHDQHPFQKTSCRRNCHVRSSRNGW